MTGIPYDFRIADFEELKRYLQEVDWQRMQGEVRSGTEFREIRQNERGGVRCEGVGQEEGRCVRKGRSMLECQVMLK